MTLAPDALDLLAFWWEAGPDKWFSTSAAFDDECRRFLALHEAAAGGDLDFWAETPPGALALILLLDQIPRNLFRATPRAFATDEAALALAEQAVARGDPRAYPAPHRNFFLLPFQHAEDLGVQERSVDLHRVLADREGYFYALVHYHAIRRFGRFPHRNRILGRASTHAEEAYLASGGFSA